MKAEKVTPQRIKAVLDKHNLVHQEYDDGDFLLPIGADDSVPYNIGIVVAFDQENEILGVYSVPDREQPEDKGNEAIAFCNAWNATRRWPCAYYRQENKSIVGSQFHAIGVGVHDALLEDMIMRGIGTCWQLYVEAAKFHL